MAGETIKRAQAIPTIDCQLVVVRPVGETTWYALDTATSIGVEPQIETTDAVKLIIKNKLRAQKREGQTITGHTITLTDNVLTPELVQILQGGTITTDSVSGEITGYKPPKVGSDDTGKIFELDTYSAIYGTSGTLLKYEKITYPNCKGNPVAFGAEDNVFRAPQYTITSAPEGVEPYTISYVDELPTVTENTGSVES